VPSTGRIGLFKIIGESAVAAGIRRIEAITAVKAEQYVHDQLKVLSTIKSQLNNAKDPVKAIEELLDENHSLHKKLESFQREKAASLKDELMDAVKEINGVKVITQRIGLDSAEVIKDLAFDLKNRLEPLFLVLGAELNGKAHLTVMLSDTLVKDKGMNASDIVKNLAKEIQGGGGGQPFYATAGGNNPSGIDNALKKASTLLG
jgi:alanyl-tRNA synthetase